ncbi:MAG TPA: type I glutamate--ammonia ligase [Verrucomicrobiota bacterium]|jgi:glutamine synthetase|nr:type I glutamate--ammonia ligase [Verrucomicrobiota bacterium]HNU99302.1 type I glutamate--ammonia ligase [Verrucomicrobiota bacterium]HOA62139.1 type I glutamate--ammonia ligase [Verrucomicrobiota bacterium]HOF49535.1 type I glutamate--ammonia ligase [Verrucomicrobiota bacterium]HOG86773.1 type I glutamate--ammonia ligase [Verrucomicrobiota bacterium]
MSTPKQVIEMATKAGAKMIDFKFVDTFGTWQHFSCPIGELTEDIFTEGLGFDGSSIRGWKSIEASDMLAMPDPATAFMDPFCAVPTLSLTNTIAETGTKEPYSRDPRGIAQKGEKYLASTGLADTADFGPEAEFFIFDNVQFDAKSNGTFYTVDSEEASWNTARDEGPNLGYKIRHKEGYFPVAPADTQQDIRTEMCLLMQELGLNVERQHHEVATAGQAEIDLRFDTLVKTADNMMLFKYVIKNVARRHGKTATFMPKPLFGDNGSGMHTHVSLWKKGKPLFAGQEYAGLSRMALYFIGGILQHAKALSALCSPTTNSYKRLVPGYEAPVNLAYSARNRSAAIRIPTFSDSPKAKRIEYRPPDPSANPYLCYTAILMAGLDGVLNKVDPGEPMDKNLYELAPEELVKVPQVPGSLPEALDALGRDHEFLLKGDVFTRDFLETWISAKRKEYDALRLRPHPYEFFLYYDV